MKKAPKILQFLTCLYCLLVLSCRNESIKSSTQTGIQYHKSLVRSNDIVFHKPQQTKKLLNIHGNLATGMPIGNGKFGGILYANVNELEIQLNHTDFWRYDPNTKYHPQYGARPFGLARLRISWPGLFNKKETKYCERLNLLEAKSIAEIGDSLNTLQIESFVLEGMDLSIFNLTPNTQEPFYLKIELSAWRADAETSFNNKMLFVCDKPKLARSENENEYLAKLTNKTHRPLYSAQSAGLRVIGGTKKINLQDKHPVLEVLVNPDEKITIIVGTEIEEGIEIENNLNAKLAKILKSQTPNRLKEHTQNHTRWWENFWEKSYVQLESEDYLAAMYEQIWYTQLYLMASSNRGKYPAKMNGSIWTVDQDVRPWGGGYWHFNQNTMHESLLAANHLGYTRRYLDLFSEKITVLKRQTDDLWNCDGVFVHETHSPDGVSYQFDRLPIYKNKPKWTSHIFSTTLEIAYQMYKYARYAGDDEYMENNVFPFMKEACLFYTNLLKKDKSGKYFMFPSNAHENHWNVKNTHNDMAAVKRCFPILIKFFEKYGDKNNEKEHFEDVLKNLSDFPIGKAIRDFSEGTKAPTISIDTSINVFAPCEFVKDWSTHNVHSVDNFSIFPFELTTVNHPLYQTAVNTVENCFFPKINSTLMRRMIPSAILHLPETTRDLCKQYLEVIQLAPNSLSGTEELGDMTIALNYMLLHSFDSLIYIAPSLPKKWDAQFKLLSQGGVLVEAQIQSGKVTYLSLLPQRDQLISLYNPWKEDIVIVEDGIKVNCSVEGRIVKWDAKKDRRYEVYPKGEQLKYSPLAIREINNSVKRFGDKQIGIE